MATNMSSPLKYDDFVSSHSPQLLLSGVPQIFWPPLHRKLTGSGDAEETILDAGTAFAMMQVCSDGDDGGHSWLVQVTRPGGLKANDPENIFLIDHSWTYKLEDARDHLATNPSLLARMEEMMGVSGEDRVLSEMWSYNQTYSCSIPGAPIEERLPLWYILDEFGSRIRHSPRPSCRVVPLLYLPQGMAYSLLYLTRDLGEGDEVTRDYLHGDDRAATTSTLHHTCCMLPWCHTDITGRRDEVVERDEQQELEQFTTGRDPDTLALPPYNLSSPVSRQDLPLAVYTEYSLIRQHLTDDRFTVVEDGGGFDDARILWLLKHYKDFRSLNENFPSKFINQFPCEHVITVKDLMCLVVRRACADAPWLPTTYNLTFELEQFVLDYQDREKRGEDNHWIIKPCNLARGLDTCVTDNLSCVVRMRETGPKIVSKYIADPVLFHVSGVGDVKFDIRYVVLLASVEPLEVYVYNKFFLRFANKPFTLSCLDDYDVHFTVMNYRPGSPFTQMLCEEFIPLFEQQNPGLEWSRVQAQIFQAVRSLFDAATTSPPPAGVAHNPQSRAMYAIDLMLQWPRGHGGGRDEVDVQILEVNYMPDCERAGLFYPNFFNDVFSTLFLDDTEGRPVTLL